MCVWNVDGTDAGKVGANVVVAAGAAGWWEVSASIIGLCVVCVLRSVVDACARVVIRYYSQRHGSAQKRVKMSVRTSRHFTTASK